MGVQFDVLKPYKSLILAQVASADGDEVLVEAIIADFRSLLDLEGNANLEMVTEGPAASFGVSHPDLPETDELHVKFLHYTEKRAPGWYAGVDEVQDTLNHLVVACQLDQQVAVYMSDSRKRTAATRRIKAGQGDGLGALRLLVAGRLNAAFVKGPARTIWLSGSHTRVSIKADNKILSGLNLRDALDPLADQSYFFTAARSSVPALGRLPVGVSPRGSRIWVGATSNWNDFVQTVASLLYHVAATTAQDSKPLPFLAIAAIQPPKLADACEVQFLPPELAAAEIDLDDETREKLQRWADRSVLEIEETEGDSLDALVTLDGVKLGKLKLHFDTSDVTNVKIEAELAPDPDCPVEYGEYQEELEEVSQNERWIKVWYESGHTLADGAIFEIRHRDLPFTEFHWADLANYKAKVEKFWSGPYPDQALELIGTQGSLFCWTKNHWPIPVAPYIGASGGWLACDDGAMEIADFIHLDTGTAVPVLTLIHVKGAKSEKPARGISVASYEIVVGQAVKNARFLDRLHLDVGLRAGLEKRIGELVWFDRQPSTREAMLEAIDGIGSSYRRMVVIFQPHVTQSRLAEVRKAISEEKDHRDRGRLRQLDTLLLGARASCQSLGAGLWVLADKA